MVTRSIGQPVLSRLLASVAPAALLLAASAPLVAPHAASGQTYAQFAGKHKLPMVQRSVLPDAEGRLGGMALDPKSGRLFFAVPRTGAVHVLDQTGMKTAQRINDLGEPSSLVFVPDGRLLAVTSGDSTVRLLTLAEDGSAKEDKKIEVRGEADPIVYDADAKRLWVGHGHFLSFIDPATGTAGGELKLPHAARGLVQDRTSRRLFATIARTGEIVVIDRGEKDAAPKIEATWTLKGVTGIHGIDIDEVSGRLFVAAREPAALLVLDMKDGREIARVPITGDADDTWYDAPGKRIYVSCGGGGGKVEMILQENADTYKLEHSEPTAAGAAQSVLLREKRRLLVTAPRLADQPTFVYFFLIPP